jgi:hypothetical protein
LHKGIMEANRGMTPTALPWIPAWVSHVAVECNKGNWKPRTRRECLLPRLHI